MNVPGGTYLITRTTVLSLFLLTPSPVVNQIMEYCLAWALRGKGILVHAVSIEGNHLHLLLTNMDGSLSDFMQKFDGCAARCLVEYYRKRFPNRRLDSVWSGAGSFCDTLLVNAASVHKELIYTYVNPVKDGLVPDYRKWPGFNTRPGDWKKGTREVTRPDYYFAKTPQTLTYEVVPPTQLLQAAGDLDTLVANVEQHIREAQAQAATNLAAEGRSFMGAKAVQRTDPFDAPKTPRPPGQLTPHLAAGGDAQALKVAATALKLFRLAYRQAWQAFKDGLDAVFPGGTLLMQKRFGVRCEPLDACWCELATASG